jgi:tRNA(Ile)-lysidine synthase
LLKWRRAELARVVELAGFRAVEDPSNGDEKYERVRVRRLLAREHWFDSEALGASAANLREADAALDWAAAREWERAVSEAAGEIVYRPDSAPPEIQRRIVMRAVAALATEGHPAQFRGRELDRLLTSLTSGEQSTLRGVRCSGGTEWRFSRAAPRRGPTARGTS